MRERLSGLLADENQALFVVEAKATLAGFAEARVEEEPRDPAIVPCRFAVLQSLWVLPEWRGAGLGRRLCQAAEDWARSLGAVETRLDLWDYAESPEGFYRNLGYEPLRQELVKPLASGERLKPTSR
jgi:GNAT superfamily N-acetyltransferase